VDLLQLLTVEDANSPEDSLGCNCDVGRGWFGGERASFDLLEPAATRHRKFSSQFVQTACEPGFALLWWKRIGLKYLLRSCHLKSLTVRAILRY
jgi:hypothetical protein